MRNKDSKILELCADIEILCDNNQIHEANSKIIELLGIVAGNSKCSKDIEKTVLYYFKKSEDYRMQIVR
ncbi:hypothetical protein ACR77J_07645 [Tissierella praeacuta]|uniref:hypothetical protein n=1 Tax=Tissierella praeacuta TaxID=43131 RepID=UPI003DA5D70A